MRRREALGFAKQSERKEIIPAEVVGRNSSLLEDTIVINAGIDRGVEEPDLPVVTANGLVGHVIQVDMAVLS